MKVSDIAWNVTGLAVPLLVAAVTVPKLLEKLGNEKFGLLQEFDEQIVIKKTLAVYGELLG